MKVHREKCYSVSKMAMNRGYLERETNSYIRLLPIENWRSYENCKLCTSTISSELHERHCKTGKVL